MSTTAATPPSLVAVTGPQCALCELVMQQLDQVLENNATVVSPCQIKTIFKELFLLTNFNVFFFNSYVNW